MLAVSAFGDATATNTLNVWHPCLYELDLLTDSRKDIFFQSVELIKAAPGAALDQTHEDAANTFEVKFPITVEHQHLHGQMGKFSNTCASDVRSWTVQAKRSQG